MLIQTLDLSTTTNYSVVGSVLSHWTRSSDNILYQIMFVTQ